jgi:hypothetical protein
MILPGNSSPDGIVISRLNAAPTVGSAMTSTKTIPPTSEPKGSIESTMHKLKLQWIMARDDAERRRISEEIRRQMGIPSSKKT